tara:strand:- start:404 stop:757 length:354 start_codon:yes stop_codon:yes gene_type:complete
MAILTAQLRLGGTFVSDVFDLSISNSNLTIDKDVAIQKITAPTAGVEIFNTTRGKSYMYIRNLDTETVSIESAASGGTQYISLEADEFAYFPWAGTAPLYAIGADNDAFIEVGIFED